MTAVRLALRTLGELLVTTGIVVLLFGAYELWGTGVYTSGQQDRLLREFDNSAAPTVASPTSSGPTPSASTTATGASPTPGAPTALVDLRKIPEGHGIGVLRIPRLGADYEKVIVEGVGVEDLKRGPGHYSGSAMPGELGNFVVSGHRTTYGAPFNRLDELRAGDPVLVETANAYFLYAVTSLEVVDPGATEVIAPVPHHVGATPTQRLLTFTTCNPKYSASQRLVVYARLVTTTPASAGPPPLPATGA